ncbi:MAG: AMP-binding protein [Acidimicrobiales bacterium]
MTIPSTFADLGIPNVPLTEYVLRHADRLADQPALIDGPSGRTITYGDLRGAIAALAGGLAARGIGKGGVVGIMAPNLPEYAVVFHGTAYAGGAVTTINPTYTAHEVTHQLNDSGATILITIGMFLETARAAVEGTKVTEIVTIDPVEGVTNLLDLFGEPLAEQVPVDPATDVVVLPYSSGTTGLSKGVMLTHRNLVANIVQCDSVLPIAEGEAILAVLPFFHIYGMQVLMNGGLPPAAPS